MEEHILLVRKVLQRLREYRMAISLEKSVFHVKKVDFWGYVVATDGVPMNEKKVESIKSWKAPASVKDIQIFIGFANFYRRFIKNFAAICTPITNLLKGDPKKFSGGKEQQEAFEDLKRRFIPGSYPMSLLSRFEHRGRNRCQLLCTWLHLITIPRQKTSSCGFPLSQTRTSRTKLRHSR